MGRREVQDVIEALLERSGGVASAGLVELTGLSRQALHRHLSRRVREGRLVREGIFFTSKMVERFELVANGLAWIVDNALSDQAIREVEPGPGTEVKVRLSARTRTTPLQIFERFTHGFEFDTTRCVIRLFQHGTEFVSRSEAKRLLANLERFREVILDFRGVEGVGQGFVDEVFRVWARAHPAVTLLPREMAPAVEFMVRRGPGGAARP